ncbi:MAG TPA: chitobiase/beta-hexosaminidase C-terminal domain-containing protein [Verrucomicrobiae bacterium]
MKKNLIRTLAVAVLANLHFIWASVLDTSFNPGTGANGIVEQVLPMPDGRILICGNFTTFNGRNHPYIARLNADGSIDESFFGQASYWVRHMSLQGDGKIVIGGFFKGVQGVSRNLIARLNSDGSLDTSFNVGAGCNGTLGVAIDGNADPFVMWTAIQPDGKVIATGNFTNYNNVQSFGIIRINPDGSRDTSFNLGGGLDSWGRHIELLSNGQILVSGWFNNYNGASFNRIARINADGSPDTSFHPFFGDRTACYDTKVVANNKIVVCGHSVNADGLFNREIKRINWDGTDDSSFVGYSNEKTESMAIQSDGKIIIGGYFNNVDGQVKTGVARMNADGTLDTSWGASIDNYVWTVAFDSSGRLLISGGFYTVDGVSRNGVARLLTGATSGGGGGGGTTSPAPTLSAAAVSSSQINLTWTDSATDRNGYTLERKTGSAGTYATLATLPASARSFANTGLAASTQYFYRLRATTTSATAVYSNEAGATTSAASGGGGTGGTATATLVGTDTATRGNWKGVYGSEGYAIFQDVASYPSYVRVTPINKSDWIWQYSTSDSRAPLKVNSASDRIAACWYSGSGYSIDLAFTDGLKHRTSLYLLDWDMAGRVETVQVVDGDTGVILYNQSFSGFSGGTYVTWDLGGHVKINLTPNSGNAVASGIFFGGSGGGGGGTMQTVATPTISPNGGSYTSAVTVSLGDSTAGAQIRYTLDNTDPIATSALYTGPFTLSGSATVRAKGFASGMNASATAAAAFTISTGGGGTSGANFVFVGADTTRGGNWIGTYGSNGYDVLPNFVSNPAYAQVSGLNKNDWTWNYSTSDGRALQTPDGASRTSGCWYSSGSFSVDVRFTDGQTHRIAVYLCDWDYAGRSETVDLLNGDTGAVVQSQTVSGFSGGRYLIWDIKGHFQLRFTRSSGPNAVVNGIFFGPAAKQL